MIVSYHDVPEIFDFFSENFDCKLTTENVAWAAGFLEGEAAFGWYDGPGAVVTVSQRSLEPLDKLKDIFGLGNINKLKARTTSHGINTRAGYTWRVNGHKAIAVMRVVKPLMTSRRQHKINEIILNHESIQTRKRQKRESPTCSRGHLWEGNTGVGRIGKKGQVIRVCLACRREDAAKRRG